MCVYVENVLVLILCLLCQYVVEIDYGFSIQDHCCNSLNFRSFSRDLRNEIDQCTYSEISPGNAHSWDANRRGKASTGLSSHDQRT